MLTVDSDISVFLALPDELLEAVFMDFLYRENQFADDIQYDDISANCTPFSTRVYYFARAIVPANRRIYRIAICVLWRCVIIRRPRDLVLVEEQTKEGSFLLGSTKMGSLTRRLELQFPGPYQIAKVRGVLERMDGLRVLVVRNYHPGRGNGFMPAPVHVFQPLKHAVRPVIRVQIDTNLVRPSRRDVLEVLSAQQPMKAFRVSGFDPKDVSQSLWTPPSSTLISSQLTTLSLGSIEPYEHLMVNPWIGTILSALTEHFALPMLTTLDLFEATDMAIPFLAVHGHSLSRLAYAAPPQAPENEDDTCVTHCPNLEELVWVMRGWGTAAPPEEGHNEVLKVAIFYVKDEDERRQDCIEQLGDAVDAFRSGGWPGLVELEIIVRGKNVPAFRACEWDDRVVFEVQMLERNKGWRAVLDVDALTS